MQSNWCLKNRMRYTGAMSNDLGAAINTATEAHLENSRVDSALVFDLVHDVRHWLS